jgi:hypothetical protein
MPLGYNHDGLSIWMVCQYGLSPSLARLKIMLNLDSFLIIISSTSTGVEQYNGAGREVLLV